MTRNRIIAILVGALVFLGITFAAQQARAVTTHDTQVAQTGWVKAGTTTGFQLNLNRAVNGHWSYELQTSCLAGFNSETVHVGVYKKWNTFANPWRQSSYYDQWLGGGPDVLVNTRSFHTPLYHHQFQFVVSTPSHDESMGNPPCEYQFTLFARHQ